MPEIKVKIDTITHEKLKAFAKDDRRSLSQYIIIGLEYLSNIPNGYHKTPIENLLSTQQQFNNFKDRPQSQSITIDQLRDAGIKDFKFNNPGRELTPEEQSMEQQKLELQQQKFELEKQKVKKQRVKFLKEKCEQILGYTLPYLENDDQTVIDLVLNKYPTDEEIVAYLEKLKEEDDRISDNDPDFYDYRKEIETLEDALPHPLTEDYKKIKDYCIAHNTTYELYQLLLYPSTIQVENYDYAIKPALDTPADYEYEKEELDLIASYFTPENK